MPDRPSSGDDDTTLTTGPGPGPAADVGDYRVLERVGVGGMGEVYLAEQLRPVRRRVALKLVKAGMDTADIVARFESERQALARMSHPNIAQVFDAGATAHGRPFFAMEYVPGIPITEYCDRARLSVRERIELFVPVCHGVQHAHQKGVLHRDVKPSNILVSLETGLPLPKIIDFGVAKATSGQLGDHPLHTRAGLPVGTPAYMSPEQADFTGLDVDTRTDIYALGAVLYELLAGAPPFDPRRLAAAGLGETLRILRDEEPPRPSARSSAAVRSDPEASGRRVSDPAGLKRQLHGDLDWIVMKALAKDRTRRYDSAKELAEDLCRHLRYEPVVAGPPSAAYRVRKFVRRHRIGVLAAAAVAVALVGALAVSTAALERARREASRARAIDEFMTTVLTSPDPARSGRDARVVDVLDRAGPEIEARFGGEPAVAAEIHRTLGTTYIALGLYDDGAAHLETAVALDRRALGDDDPETLESLAQLSAARYYEGRPDEAETIARDVLARRRRILGDEDRRTLASMSLLGAFLNDRARFDEAEGLYRKLCATSARVLGERDPDTLTNLNNLAFALRKQDKLDEAGAIYRRVLDGRRATLGPDHPETLLSMTNLAFLLQAQKRYPEAEALHREAFERKRRVLGDDHPETLSAMNGVALALREEGKPGEAAAMYERLLASPTVASGGTGWRGHVWRTHYARCLALMGRRDAAEAQYRLAIDGLLATLGPDHPQTAGARRQLDELLESGR